MLLKEENAMLLITGNKYTLPYKSFLHDKLWSYRRKKLTKAIVPYKSFLHNNLETRGWIIKMPSNRPNVPEKQKKSAIQKMKNAMAKSYRNSGTNVKKFDKISMKKPLLQTAM